MVDNCYGEFTETIELSDAGADMVVKIPAADAPIREPYAVYFQGGLT